MAKCEFCGFKKSVSVGALSAKGFSCGYCSDGFSIPEKFGINLFKQLNVEFKTQYVINDAVCGKKYYDFYISKLNMIIETHGLQHYEQGGFNKSLNYEQENDNLKYELA